MSKTLLKNIAWSAYGVVLNQIITFITLIVLIKHLTPSDFGLVNMVIIIAGFANTLSDFGFGQALIQYKEASTIDYSTVFWFNLFLGISISTTLFLFSSLISSFYGNTLLIPITKLLSIKYIFSSAIIVHKIYIQKNLNFRLNANIDIFVNILTSLLTVIAVYLGFGYWSLVLQTVSESIFAMLLFSIYVKWKPTFKFSISSFKKLSKFSIDVFLNQSFFYWTANLDKILIGKYLGDFSLGIYKNAFSVINKPISILSSTLLRVLFPSYSMLQNNITELRSIVLKLFKTIAIIVIPTCTILYLSADFIIRNYLSNEWTQSIPLVKIFSIAAIPFAFSSITSPVYLALGKSRLILFINLITRSILILLTYLALQKGLNAIAYVLLFINIIRLIIDIIQFRNILKIKDIKFKFGLKINNLSLVSLSLILTTYLINNQINSIFELSFLLVITYSLVFISLYTSYKKWSKST
ncbi:MAG: lipopolysaccharide biosynthesis protein [Ignavibacteria bacterium]|nr:lipopolysaccharide biosynthesis protein [Ignavibacteria bacterium]